MRTILDIFRLVPYPHIEYIYVGKMLLLFVCIKNLKELEVWNRFNTVSNSIVYIYENSLDIYILDDIINLIEIDFLVLLKINYKKN